MDGVSGKEVPTSDGPVIQAAKWYVRSGADHDTHRGRLFGNGTVMAECDLVFQPVKALRNRGPALPGYPPDPDQVCPKCKRSGGAGR